MEKTKLECDAAQGGKDDQLEDLKKTLAEAEDDRDAARKQAPALAVVGFGCCALALCRWRAAAAHCRVRCQVAHIVRPHVRSLMCGAGWQIEVLDVWGWVTDRGALQRRE